MSECVVLGRCGQLCHACSVDPVNKDFSFKKKKIVVLFELGSKQAHTLHLVIP